MARTVIRIALALVLLMSAAVIVVALVTAPREIEAWAGVAASLAVIAAVISAWSAQRVFELQEDALQPHPYPSIDIRSRYGLFLLRVTNLGGTPAHNIRLVWDKPLINSEGKRIRFTQSESGAEISVLLPNESIATTIDGHADFYAKYPGAEANYSGKIVFTDASGREYRQPFVLSAEQYAGTPVHDEEILRTHYDLQQIPSEIRKIGDELGRIRQQLRSDSRDLQSPRA